MAKLPVTPTSRWSLSIATLAPQSLFNLDLSVHKHSNAASKYISRNEGSLKESSAQASKHVPMVTGPHSPLARDHRQT